MKLLKSIVTGIAWLLGAAVLISFLGTIAMVASVIGKGMELSLEEHEPTKTDRAVAVVDLSGEILSSEKFSKKLRKQVEDADIKAIVVQIDSPGGAVGAAEEMYRAILAADKKKPVFCSLGSVAASGGFYAAMACRKVFTHAGTISGSIGVILMSPNFTTIMERLGVGVNVIKSGQFKDAGSPFRPATDAERSLLQALVNQAYEQFVRVIATGRKLDLEKIRPVADGRVILGESLVELGFADSIGGVEEAATEALAAAGGAGEPEIVYPKSGEGLLELFGEIGQSSSIRRLLGTNEDLQLLYR